MADWAAARPACGVPTDYFDERVARVYDTIYADLDTPDVVEPAVDVLAGLAGDGAALELGVGTGRLALPLSRRGVVVHGIDLSPSMLDQLRAKPGADAITVTVGDMATTALDRTFTVVYLVRNALANLTSQDAQVACFERAAAHLEPGGCFVIELYVPELRRLPADERFHAFAVTPAHVGVEEYDVVTQIAYSHHWWAVDGRLEHFSAPFRYVWPAELDLMAQIAGLELRERWSDWTGAPFTSESRSHVSIWEKPASPPR